MINLDTHDEHLIVLATQYARERSTYIVRTTTSWLENHWDTLTGPTRTLLRKEVEEETNLRRKAQAAGAQSATSAVDNPDWESLHDFIQDYSAGGAHDASHVILDADDEFLVVSALRYSQRNDEDLAYMSKRVLGWWDELSEATRSIIARDAELELELRREEPATNDEVVEEWEQLLNRIEN